MANRLLDVAPLAHDRWTGSRELVRIGEVCLDGHGPLASKSHMQGVLFRFGGYGAPVRTTVLICLACFWSVTSEVTEVHPKRWEAA